MLILPQVIKVKAEDILDKVLSEKSTAQLEHKKEVASK
jgi:hypothetical protein